MNTRKIVDELGRLKAEIAPLVNRFDHLKEKLAALGPDLYTGRAYDARVTKCQRVTLDAELVRELLSEKAIDAISRTSEVNSVTVTARLISVKAA